MTGLTQRMTLGSLLRRPETGSFLGLALVFAFFWIFGGSNFAPFSGAASWLNVAASLGIIAIPIGLLMISGELDISIGSMVPAGSMTCAIISGHFLLPIIVGVGATLALGTLVGLINGLLVVRTAAPSFIVTLGTLFAVAGLTLGLWVIITGTTSDSIKAGPEAKFLLGHFIGAVYQVTIFWWIVAAAFWAFVLHYSKCSNWILAMGGDKVSARNAGIPTERVTIILFMCSGMTAPILSLKGINKSFGPIDVLHDINLEVRAGEVLCLLGDNGAGKSTVIRILSGVHKPTWGVVAMDGKPVSFSNPRSASDHGIATVHQFGGTFPLMSIGRGFFVGREPTKGFGPFKVFDPKHANEVAVKAVRGFGITWIDNGDRLLGGLSGGERQALVIARAVHFGARVLILDEPTAALGVKEATHVLHIVLEVRRCGIAVIFITHQVTHALTVGDHFAVLIRGAKAADFRKGEKTREEITDLMAGGEAMAELEAEIESYSAEHAASGAQIRQ